LVVGQIDTTSNKVTPSRMLSLFKGAWLFGSG
jgi:hypothetical protein